MDKVKVMRYVLKKTYACYYIKIIPYVLSRLMATTEIKKKKEKKEKKKCSNCSYDPWKVWIRDKNEIVVFLKLINSTIINSTITFTIVFNTYRAGTDLFMC